MGFTDLRNVYFVFCLRAWGLSLATACSTYQIFELSQFCNSVCLIDLQLNLAESQLSRTVSLGSGARDLALRCGQHDVGLLREKVFLDRPMDFWMEFRRRLGRVRNKRREHTSI